jgi:hypothetical protein
MLVVQYVQKDHKARIDTCTPENKDQMDNKQNEYQHQQIQSSQQQLHFNLKKREYKMKKFYF